MKSDSPIKVWDDPELPIADRFYLRAMERMDELDSRYDDGRWILWLCVGIAIGVFLVLPRSN